MGGTAITFRWMFVFVEVADWSCDRMLVGARRGGNP